MRLFKKGHSGETFENELYNQLFLRHSDGIFTLDSFDSIQEANEQFSQRLGYKSEEIVESSFSSFIIMEDSKRYLTFWKKVLNGESDNIEITLLHRNGERLLTRLTYIPILSNENGMRIYGFAKPIKPNSGDFIIVDDLNNKDMTVRAQEIGHFGVWKYDVHQDQFSCSEQMCHIFGWDYRRGFKISYHSLISRIHLEDRKKIEFDFNNALDTGNSYDHEYRIFTSKGERYIQSQGDAIKNDAGDIVRLIGTVHDITELRQVEKEKAELEQWYKSLYTFNTDATYILDKNGMHKDINQAAIQLLGYSKQEVLNRDIKSLVHPKDLQQAVENFKEVLKGSSKTIDLTLLHKDGHEVNVTTTSSPVVIDGKIVGIIGTSKDITEQKEAQRLLEENEQRYRSLFLYNTDAAASIDMNGNYMECNPALEQLVGYSTEELLKGSFSHLCHPDDLEKTWDHFDKARKGDPQNFEIVCKHRNGYFIDINVTMVPMTVNGEIVGVYAIAKDISERNKAFKALQDAEEMYRTLVEESVAAVFIFQDEQLVYTNPKAHQLLGISDSLVGRALWDFIHPDDVSGVQALQLNVETETKSMSGGCRMIGEGKVMDVEFHISPFTYEGKKAIICTVLDVTEQKKVLDHHSFLAHHDSLTNLPNRRLFEQKVEQSLIIAKTCNQKLAVMYVDLDRFKYINDTLGHEIGDQLLQYVSERIKQSVRDDDVLSRIGGDEFTILLPMVTNIDQAVEIAESIRISLEKPFHIGEYELFITSSIGISMYPFDGEDVKTLLKTADIALYRAKEYGKNNHQVYSSSMNVQTFKSYALEKDLRRAIHQGELELYYQPRVDAISGHIQSGEALVRWNHPDWGMISPSEFIPLAEESGLIIPLGNWVQETAYRQNKVWQQMGLAPIPISINMSPQRFLQKDMIESLEGVLSSTGLDPQWVEIEITEDSLLKNEDLVIHALNYLNDLGVKVAIDDFGTGYSSLSYLKRFRFDTLKIDKSFIQGITEDVRDAQITAAATHLAKSLGATVVAEGVESIGQLHFLQKIKCDQIQGYLFSKPVPVDEFTKLLRKKKLSFSSNNGVPDTQLENQRKYFRLELFFPFSAQMTIVQIKGRDIDLGETEVLIEDIGLGGIKILTTMKLAIHQDIILEFKTEILGKIVTLQGVVVWTKELRDGIFQYGVEFRMVEGERIILAQVLNELALHLRKSPLVPNCKLIKMDRFNYLKAIRDGILPPHE